MKQIAAFFLVVLLSLMSTTSAFSASLERYTMVVGSGNIAGDFYPLGGAVCFAVNMDRIKHEGRCLVDVTKGSIYNLSALRAGDVNFAIARSDWALHAFNGTERFEGVGPDTQLQQVTPLLQQPLLILTTRASGIAKPSDLVGRRVFVGPDHQATEALLNHVWKAYDIAPEDITFHTQLQSKTYARALCQGEVEALAFVMSHPNGLVMEAISDCPLQVMALDQTVLADTLAQHPEMAWMELPSNLYGRLETNNTLTFGYSVGLFTTEATDKKWVRTLLKSAIEHAEDVSKEHPALRHNLIGENPPILLGAVPFHPGASEVLVLPDVGALDVTQEQDLGDGEPVEEDAVEEESGADSAE